MTLPVCCGLLQCHLQCSVILWCNSSVAKNYIVSFYVFFFPVTQEALMLSFSDILLNLLHSRVFRCFFFLLKKTLEQLHLLSINLLFSCFSTSSVLFQGKQVTFQRFKGPVWGILVAPQGTQSTGNTSLECVKELQAPIKCSKWLSGQAGYCSIMWRHLAQKRYAIHNRNC